MRDIGSRPDRIDPVANAPSLSVFLPMYNEKESVHRMVAKAQAVLKRLTGDYEVLIVDDGSTDGSERVADTLAAQNAHVRVIHHPRNMGYGVALQTGFSSATKDLVFYTDCDEPVDLGEIERAVALMVPGVDLVIGYRIDRHDTLRRWAYSRAYNLLVRWLFGLRVRDVNFSFKLVRRSVLERLSLCAGSTFIDGQILVEAVCHGSRMVEIPLEYYPRQFGRSSFDNHGAALHALREMLSYWLRTLPLARLSPSSGLWQLGRASTQMAPALCEPAHAAMLLMAFPLTMAEWPFWRISPLGDRISGIAALVLLFAGVQSIWHWRCRAGMQGQRTSGPADPSRGKR